jgi:uncharacterized protein (TIGR02246 family)
MTPDTLGGAFGNGAPHAGGVRFDRSRTADLLEIAALVTEFAHLIDRGSPHRVADLFTPDGWYGRDGGARSVGRDAIRTAYARRGDESPARVSRHLFSNLRVEFDGADSATGTSTLTLIAGDGAAPLPMNISLVQDYVDSYARIEGSWLFESRETRRLFVSGSFREVLHLGTPK